MNYTFSKILVTGGAGFIGCNFVRYLLAQRPGMEIVILDKLTYAGNLKSLADVLADDNGNKIIFIKGDICDRDIVATAMAGCDAVVNIAAESHVDRSIMDSSPFIRTNVFGTQVLLDEARRQQQQQGGDGIIKRFLQVSTDEVYGSLPLDRPELKFSEESPIDPHSPYAASKAAADVLALSYYHTFGMPVLISRCSNNLGPYQFPEKVIPLFILNLMQGEPVPLYGDGLNVRDWIHVEDHCAALLLILESGKSGEVYNVGSGNEYNNLELTHTLLKILGRDETFIKYVKDRLGHDRRYAMDARKLIRELSWQAVKSAWPQALEDTVKWYQENMQWWESIISGEYKQYYEKQYGGCDPNKFT